MGDLFEDMNEPILNKDLSTKQKIQLLKRTFVLLFENVVLRLIKMFIHVPTFRKSVLIWGALIWFYGHAIYYVLKFLFLEIFNWASIQYLTILQFIELC